MTCTYPLFWLHSFFCIVCLQWMNCTACRWFSWILLFLFGKSFSFFLFDLFKAGILLLFLVLYRSPCLQCDSLKLRHVQWKTRRAGQAILPRPLLLTWVKDASKIKPLVMSTRDALPQCLCATVMMLSFILLSGGKTVTKYRDFKIAIPWHYYELSIYQSALSTLKDHISTFGSWRILSRTRPVLWFFFFFFFKLKTSDWSL